MNNNSIIIDKYLQNEMAVEEKMAFEKRLETDHELKLEFEAQKQIISAIRNAGLKETFAKTINQKIIVKKYIQWGSLFIIAIAGIMLFLFRNNIFNNLEKDKTTLSNKTIHNIPFIKPPMPEADVPFKEYRFVAEKGEIIFHQSGSIIEFPPSALIDDAGKLIKGMVTLQYREFSDPLDFFVSGIPMDYDSAGVKFHFESSGMCEIKAFQNNKAVFVNQQAKPVIHLSGTNNSPLHNLYFLDTVNRNWSFKGKDTIHMVKNVAPNTSSLTQSIIENETLPQKPIMPYKASGDRQAFSIEIEPGSFEELFAYDRLKFEVVDDNTYNSADAEIHWENVKLEHTSTEGIYNVTFTNANRNVTYKVRPVLDEADYDASLKIFKQKIKVYNEALKRRALNEKTFADIIINTNKALEKKWNEENAKNERINELIVSRNKSIRLKQNEEAKKIEMNLSTLDKGFADQVQSIRTSDKNMEIMRSFSINNFGIWNCDHPNFPDKEIPITGTFVDSSNNKLDLPSIAVVYKNFNGICQFTTQMPIRVVPDEQNMIWALTNAGFYYFTYKDFKETGINKLSTAYTFKLRKARHNISSYDDIRALAERL
jgi:hypothetical protein